MTTVVTDVEIAYCAVQHFFQFACRPDILAEVTLVAVLRVWWRQYRTNGKLMPRITLKLHGSSKLPVCFEVLETGVASPELCSW